MRSLTGGPLNWLNGAAGVSAPARSVPVMALIRAHRPRSAQELVELIAAHREPGCACGIRSQGTIEDFGRSLYLAQDRHWGARRFSQHACTAWIYHLFVTNSLRGGEQERRAAHEIQPLLPESFCVRDADAYVDAELRIDLEISCGERILGGIQVKPSSYEHVRHAVRLRNQSQQARYGNPVVTLVYDSQSGAFLNLGDVLGRILGWCRAAGTRVA